MAKILSITTRPSKTEGRTVVEIIAVLNGRRHNPKFEVPDALLSDPDFDLGKYAQEIADSLEEVF